MPASVESPAARVEDGACRFVLASRSPRRIELLRNAGYDPVVDPADVDERDPGGLTPRQLAEYLADLKASVVSVRHPAAVVLAADTLVVADGIILGKPETDAEARRMLRVLSGTTHEVMTAVTVVRVDGARDTEVVTSQCRMKRLDDDEIDRYVASGAWRGKAGGYGIQDDGGDVFTGDPFVERVAGSYTNIVGLPMEAATRMLADAGVHPSRAEDSPRRAR